MNGILNKLDRPLLSQQAKQAVIDYINTMDLASSTKLPREESMAEMLGVSRITVRKALADLAAEGRIFRIQGKGTFVNEQSANIKVTFNPAMEFTQMIRKSGFVPSIKILKVRENKKREDICHILNLKKSEKLIQFDKAFFADDKLCILCSDFFSVSIAGNQGQNVISNLSDCDRSLFPYVYENFGKKILWDKVEIDTVISTEIADFTDYLSEMNIGIRPYLYLRTTNYEEENKPLIYSEEYIDTSIIKYNMIRQKNIQYNCPGE